MFENENIRAIYNFKDNIAFQMKEHHFCNISLEDNFQVFYFKCFKNTIGKNFSYIFAVVKNKRKISETKND